MPKTIISDTSCLILLDKISELDILNKLFDTITTTPEIVKEFGQPLPSWFVIQQPADKNYQSIIEASLDKGEASAIALAIEMDEWFQVFPPPLKNNFPTLQIPYPQMVSCN